MSFAGAPVSQALVFVICVTSLVAATTSAQQYFNLPLYPHLTRDYQWWRLGTHQLAFTNSSELFIGTLLLYFTSVPVERSFGSHKYASFLVACSSLATCLSIASLLLFSQFGLKQIPAGPFILLFAVITQSIRLIPTVFYWRLFGIEVTSRIALWVLAAQLVFSQPPVSAYLALLGFLTSSLYLSNILSLRTFRISPRIMTLSSRLISPLLPPQTPPQRSTVTTLTEALYLHQRAAEQAAGNAGGGMAGFVRGGTFLPSGSTGGRTTTPAATTMTTTSAARAAAPTGTPPVPSTTIVASPPTPAAAGPRGFVRQWTEGITGGQPTPSQEQIAELMAIFPEHPREAVVSALQRNQLNVEQAAAALLSS